ncbi:hypothetical protein G20c_64 [Thermus phage G20c]|nr:hypothetical protein G20c_64 [Thermus phage G20c]
MRLGALTDCRFTLSSLPSSSFPLIPLSSFSLLSFLFLPIALVVY